MKICLLVLNNFTNDARVHKEASTLAAAGYEVSVVALWQAGLAETEQQSGYRIYRIALKSRSWRNKLLSPPIKYLEFAWRVQQLTKKEPAQVYHANDANTLPAAWWVARQNHAKIIYDAHELEVGRDFNNSRLSWIYRSIWAWPEKLFIKKATNVLTVSQSIAAELKRIYRIPLPIVILNCPDNPNIAQSTRLRDELGIPKGLLICLYQGHIASGRGVKPFLEAVQLLPDVAGVALGDGPLLEEFRQYVQEGKWQRVYLTGKVSLKDLPYYTSSADLGLVLNENIAPSFYYSLPNKLFEYLHGHIPLIGNNLPEIADIITTTKTGVVVDKVDAQSIAEAINIFVKNPEFYNQCKLNTQLAASKYNWQTESKKLLDVYARLLDKGAT
jgi:glycosyltransferase involved in cell wall biosynthesis